MSGNKAVIWDMDGVIADTAPYHRAAWQTVFRDRGLNYHEDDFRLNFGKRNDTIIRAVLGNRLRQAELTAIANEKETIFREQAQGKLKALPGVIGLMGELKDHGLLQALGSSAPIDNIRLIVTELAITDYFQAIVAGADAKEGKPSPEVFLIAADRLDCTPGRCVVIEDAVAGVAAARNAGMKCLAVTNTNPAAKLSAADLITDSLEEITPADLINL